MKPWLAVDLLNNESIGRFATEHEALMDPEVMRRESVVIQYRPRAKRKTRKFP